MDDEELTAAILELVDSDRGLSEDTRMAVMGALESDEFLAQALDDEHRSAVRQRPERPMAPPEPVRAYLKAITVRGFRGVGPQATLSLCPRPGLTVVAGRNGSGKSTFAEALEFALTGNSYRWSRRSTLWKSHWRNVHDGSSCLVSVNVAEEGSGITTLTAEWADAAGDPGLHTRWVQRKGHKREAGTGSLGWDQPLETFRPLLSYEELGGLLEGKPSELYDALHTILGLERLATAQQRLDAAVKTLSQPQADARSLAKDLIAALSEAHDERASRALTVLKDKHPDLDTLSRLAESASAEATEERAQLRVLANLQIPLRGEVHTTAAAPPTATSKPRSPRCANRRRRYSPSAKTRGLPSRNCWKPMLSMPGVRDLTSRL
jgi:DNA repair exonuclease SbcCD ATPase subunit